MSTTVAEQIEKLISAEANRRLEDLSTSGISNIVAKKYFEVAEENERLKESLRIASEATKVYREQCEKLVAYNKKLEGSEFALKVEIENQKSTLRAYQLLSKELRASDVMSVLGSDKFHDFFSQKFQEYLNGTAGVSEREVRDEITYIFNL